MPGRFFTGSSLERIPRAGRPPIVSAFAVWIAEIHCQPRFSLLRLMLCWGRPGHEIGALESPSILYRFTIGPACGTGGDARPAQPRAHGFRRRRWSPPVAFMNVLTLITGRRMRSWRKASIIRRAWSEDRLTFHGKFFQIPEVVVNPKRCSVLCHRSARRRALDGVKIDITWHQLAMPSILNPRAGRGVRRRLLDWIRKTRTRQK